MQSGKDFQFAIVDFKYDCGKFESVKDGVVVDIEDEEMILERQKSVFNCLFFYCLSTRNFFVCLVHRHQGSSICFVMPKI